ncbi:MAG: TetR family transcriptional regulator [Pseudooceanicola sp.]|jgi:AcrR family transcriptional regulator|nr:TetR family transcriptional regulator [Pseudooceanicola sp.]|tara:strand:- start:12 stop:596 length:585 start_codon:yes stop_codon:yes gene_type:complete
MRDAIAPDPRQQAILDAAWHCFAAYGFRKTSMDDIARAAQMSRPALYQHYRNKEDIFRSLAAWYYDQAVIDVGAALAGQGDVQGALRAAMATQGAEIVKAMLSSPHGMDLIDSTKTTAADIVTEGEARLTAVYADWLAAQAQAGRVRLSAPAEQVAQTITAAMKGLKMDVPDFDSYRMRLATLADIVAAGLTKP